MGWQQDVEKLRAGGFSESDIARYAEEQRAALTAGGFSDTEIGEYFGVKEFNPEPVRRMFQANLDAARQANTDEAGQPRKELSFTDYLEAGWQTSVAGLVTRGKAPEAQVPPDAPMWGRLVAQGAALAGDAIPMAVGAVAGGAAGSAAPVVGTTVGAGAGAFALPAALRETLMQAYTKGEVTSWADFYGRASAVFLETLKGAAVGGATSGLGAAAKVAVGARGAAPLAAEAAGITAEVATMTTLGSAMEGRVPEPKDFLDAAVLVFGLRGATAGAAKLRDIYAKTGIRPEEVAQDAQREATIKQDLYASNKDIPGAYEAKVERPAEGAPPPPGPEGPKGPDAPLPEPPKLRQPSDVPMQAPEAYATDADALAAAKAHVRSRISIGESAKEPWSFREFYKNTLDSLDPVLQAVEGMAGGKRGAEELLPSEDAYRLARLTKGSAGKAFMFLERRTTKYGSNETTGEALKTFLDPVMKEREEFTEFVVAQQAVEEHARGRETGIDPYAAALVVKAGQAKFGKAAGELRQFNARLYRYMADAGFYSHETVENTIANNQTYTPFHAVIETRGKKVGGLGAGLTVRDPVKGRKGSDLRKIDPLETTVKNVYLFTALVDRNAAIRAYVEHAEKSPVGEFFARKAPAGKSAKGADAGEMTTDLALLALGEDVPAELASPFRPQAFNPAFDEIAFFRNGEREVWRVDPEVASAFKGLDVETVPWLVKILSIPAKSLRAGAVLSPDFMLKNPIRDTVDAFINSKSGFVPVLDTVRGLMELWKQGKPFEEWLLGGGSNAAATALDRDGLQWQLRRILGDPGAGVRDKVWNVAKTPMRILQAISELSENATRLGEAMKASRKARAEGMSDWDAILHGGFESREVTFDFGRMGAKMKAANMLIAFLGSQLQGADRTVRTFIDNPFGATAKAVGSVTLASVLLYFANKDDPRWKDRETAGWIRDHFWEIHTGDPKTGYTFRIAKPPLTGLLFGSMVERILDAYFGDNPNAFKDVQWTIFSALAPNVVPTVAQPILEQWANRSFFTGQNLVPSNLERGLPEYQYSEYTTELSKLVGRLVGSVPGMHESQAASPMVLDNYVRNWTGTLGVYAWQITDKVLREAAASDTALGKKLREWKAVEDLPKPALTLADIPLVKAFVVRHPSASAQVIQDFHDEYERSKKIQHTVQMLTQRGDVDARQREQRLNLRESMIRLDGMNDALGQMRQEIKALSLAPDSAKDPKNGISADERRQLIDGIYFQMIDLAKGGMKIIRAMDKALEAK